MFKTKNGDRYCIMTTRFNLKTLKENRNYLKKLDNKMNGDDIHCIYGTPSVIDDSIPSNIPIFVIEMLNVPRIDSNYPGKIAGIGIIRNKTTDVSYRIYSNHNYNRHIYIGEKRIQCLDLNEDEKSLIRRMEFALFYGPRHHKRSDGITKLPQYILEAFPSFATFLLDYLRK